VAKLTMPIFRVGRLNNSRGFTLTELSIVLFLISLFAVISVPLFSNVGENHLKHSTRRISSIVKYLYNEAALTATPHRLIFNLEQNNCTPQRQSALNEWQPVCNTVRSYQLPTDVNITAIWIEGKDLVNTGTATIEFHPQGWLPATTIHLQKVKKNEDDETTQLSIHLLPFTGSVEIEEGYHEFD